MKQYLAAHDAFTAWLDQIEELPEVAEFDRRLWDLAQCAAQRGMTSIHWTFVVDGLVAHANRRSPGNVALSSCVARGFDLCPRWTEILSYAEASQSKRA